MRNLSELIAKDMKIPIRVVALRDTNEDSLERSASGGAYPLLARPILKQGGAVFGSEMLAGGVVRHTMIESIDDLPRHQGSKYVKSETKGAFAQCAEVLKDGRRVLFSGTPCQIIALRSYLRSLQLDEITCSRLYTVDIICHGVTNPELFRLYIMWLEGRLDAVPGTLRYEFRSKRHGWGPYCYHYFYTSRKDGRRRERFGPCDEDPYYAAFLEGNLYRNQCYTCQFASPERVGDFTIGDYWGIDRAHPEFDYKMGASLLMINTAAGMSYFSEECEPNCILAESSIELATRENHNLHTPTVRTHKGAKLAAIVSDAVKRGDADLVFGSLLKRPFSVKRILKKYLPARVITALKHVLHRQYAD